MAAAVAAQGEQQPTKRNGSIWEAVAGLRGRGQAETGLVDAHHDARRRLKCPTGCASL